MSESVAPVETADLAVKITELAGRINEMIRVTRYQSMGPERVFEFAAYDHWVKMNLPLALTDVIQSRIFARREFFEAESLADIRQYIKSDSVVVDAGANIGNHTVFFALVCGAKLVHAFEPTRVSFRTLQRNVELNELKNVKLHNTGLGAGAGRLDLARWVQHNTGGTVLQEAKDDAESAYPMIALDSLGLKQMDFLKIDVEGMQIAMLAGARETIQRCKPVIWVELRQKRSEYDAGAAAMEEMGYGLIRMVKGSENNDFLFGPK